jgi:hypothetical protein
MTTLEEVMNYNENFHKQVKVAPNCRFDEGQALQEHYRDCVKQWLEQIRDVFESEDSYSSRDVIRNLLYQINCVDSTKGET